MIRQSLPRSAIAKTVFVPHTAQDYECLIELLDSLINQIGENETHPLASMMDIIGVLIENYEPEHVPELEEVARLTIPPISN